MLNDTNLTNNDIQPNNKDDDSVSVTPQIAHFQINNFVNNI